MSRIRKNKFLKGLLVALIYLAGGVICVFVIGILPILTRRTTEIRHAYTLWGETVEGASQESAPWRNQYSRILMYDENRELVWYAINEPGKTPEDLREYIGRWEEQVYSGNNTFNITRDVFRSSPVYLWLASGTAITEDGAVKGAVFLIQDIQIIQNAVIYFLVFYSALYWIFVVILMRYASKRQKLEELQKNYVANITHQLKTPIATISALTESLCDGMVDDPQKQQLYYGRILKETQNQAHMISENLELSRLQSDSTPLKKQYVMPAEIFDRIKDKYSILCEYNGLEFILDDELWQLGTLYTDASSVVKILEILLDNSLKYVPDGGTVKIWCMNANPVTIIVSDNGPGIKKEELGYVFERFYRCSGSEGIDGSGLGLSIAQETAAKLKEKLYVKSIFGKGTDFFLTIHRK